MYKNIYLISVHKVYYNNRIFELKKPDNFFDALYPERTYPYCLLKKKLAEKNIPLNTFDFFNKKEAKNYALIFIDIPLNIKQIVKKHPFADKFLLIWESPIISKMNNNKENHKYFKKIFTWQNSLIDNKKYFKLNYANTIPKNIDFDLSVKEKLCTMIAGHKFKDNPQELYTERVRAIKWFEKNALQDFDFYGKGWDRHYFKEPFIKLNRLTLLTKFLKPTYPSYKGPAKNREDVYKRYKFAICYENSIGSDGYISEKIFDCFFNGCVPIYLGEKNIKNYIPENTFIDKRNFKNYRDLYSFIKKMPDIMYLGYLNAIKKYISSNDIYPFSAECFANTISKEITKE